MKNEYKEVKVRIEEPQDIVTTSPEVETGRIPFPWSSSSAGENTRTTPFSDDGILDPTSNANYNI